MARLLRALLLLLVAFAATPGLACHQPAPVIDQAAHADHHQSAPAPAADTHDHLGLCCAIACGQHRTTHMATLTWPAPATARTSARALHGMTSALDPPPPRIG